MQTELQIAYRHNEPSDALNALIRSRVTELEQSFDHITRCRVVIDGPPGHHRKGAGAPFHLRVEVSLPGEVLVVVREAPQLENGHDAFAAMNGAFQVMGRRLEDAFRRRRKNRLPRAVDYLERAQ